jgi:hypothetical protein
VNDRVTAGRGRADDDVRDPAADAEGRTAQELLKLDSARTGVRELPETLALYYRELKK